MPSITITPSRWWWFRLYMGMFVRLAFAGMRAALRKAVK
jgi:hypothetical protein